MRAISASVRYDVGPHMPSLKPAKIIIMLLSMPVLRQPKFISIRGKDSLRALELVFEI